MKLNYWKQLLKSSVFKLVVFLLVDSCGFVLGVSTLRFFVSLYSVCRVLIAVLSLYRVCPVPILVRVTLQCMSCSHPSACHSTVYIVFPSQCCHSTLYVRFPSQCVSPNSVCPVPILVRVTVLCMPCFHCSASHSTVYILFPRQCVSLYSVRPAPIIVRVTLQSMSLSHRSAYHSTVCVLFPS